MLKDVCNYTIDFNSIQYVSPLSNGNDMWVTFNVYFKGGNMLQLPHEIKYAADRDRPQIKREEFVNIWKEIKS